MGISRLGLAKSAVTEEAWALTGVRARRLVGRLERGSAEVGIDSGMGSDIVEGGWLRGREEGKGFGMSGEFGSAGGNAVEMRTWEKSARYGRNIKHC